MDSYELAKYISSGFDKAKAGNALEIYNCLTDNASVCNIPTKSHYGFGWIIYYALHQSHDAEITRRKQMLARYLSLQVTKPHKLHSMVLTQAIRLYKDARNISYGKKPEETVKFSILSFLKLWGLENLRPGDWRRKEFEGNKLSSTVEKLITVLADELENSNTVPDREVIELIDRAADAYPDSYNIYAQRSVVCRLMGVDEEVRRMLRKALLLAPGKFFLWSKLAAVTPLQENPNLHIALLCKALATPGPDKFKGKIRLSLAEALVSRGAYPQALWELERVKQIYTANNWHLPAAYVSLSQRIPQETTAEDPQEAYKRVAHLADDHIYADIPATIMSKTYHKMPDVAKAPRYGRLMVAWRLTDAEGNHVWFKPEQFGIDPGHPAGTKVSVKLHNGKVVKANIISA